MKEIKFRVWDKKVESIIEYPNELLKFTHYYNNKENCEIMQYTWVKDKNWKEIYEWDILYNRNKETLEWYRWEVVFSDGCFELRRIWYKTIQHRLTLYTIDFEIMWNIYENTELL